MQIKAYDYRYTRDGDIDLILTVPRSEKTAVTAIFNEFSSNDVKEVKKRRIYVINIVPQKKKRSLDANAYAWVLMGQIADRIGVSNIDVYREAISKMNVYEVIPVREDVLERWVQTWESHGKGWLCESLGKSKIEGYINTQCYYGSSVYDTAEMARLVDYIVGEATDLGIETKTPDEIARLKSLWKGLA